MRCEVGDSGTRRPTWCRPRNVGGLTDELWSREAFLARGDLQHFLARFAGLHRLTPNS